MTRVVHRRVVSYTRLFDRAPAIVFSLTLDCGHTVEHDGLEPLPAVVACPACGRSAVSRTRIVTLPPPKRRR